MIQNGKLVPLSEKQLVDCVRAVPTLSHVVSLLTPFFPQDCEASKHTSCSPEKRADGSAIIPPVPSAGCNGGLMTSAYDYLMLDDVAWIATENSYGYAALQGKCRINDGKKHFKQPAPGAALVSYFNVTPTQEALVDAAIDAPVAIAIDASNQMFQTYKSGIFSSCHDTMDALDHGVLITGVQLAAPSDGSKYGKGSYIVKNSWSDQSVL